MAQAANYNGEMVNWDPNDVNMNEVEAENRRRYHQYFPLLKDWYGEPDPLSLQDKKRFDDPLSEGPLVSWSFSKKPHLVEAITLNGGRTAIDYIRRDDWTVQIWFFGGICTEEERELNDNQYRDENQIRKLNSDFKLIMYGGFLHTELVPNALFLLDEIRQYDRFEFRKALRNHEIDLIVLSSPGGSVWESLTIAGIINDKQLTTYVPKTGLDGEGDCASACSFMFFAGASRAAEGRLGVHQFYSSDTSSVQQVEEVEGETQFTVSEIIGFLNEFETPPWVFERMFQQADMYYFKESELSKLETKTSNFLLADFEKSEQFILKLSDAIKELSE